MALSTLKPDGTQGTAIVELTFENGKEIRRHYGCIVENDANLESFIKTHIKQSADKTKFKNSKYYVCIYDPGFEERNQITVSCHRFSKPRKPKKCELNFSPHNFVKVQGHIFIPCDSQYFNDSKFLEKHSKKILEAQELREEMYGLMYDEKNKFLELIPVKLVDQLSPNMYGIGAEDYKKLEDAGPVLLKDNKIVVGSFKKRGNDQISISIFGNNQDGAPGDGTEQAAATPGDRTGQVAATPGDRTGQVAATPGDRTGQVAGTPGDGTVQAAATLGDEIRQVAGTPGDGTGQAVATPGDEIGQVAGTPGDGTGQSVDVLESAPGDEDEADSTTGTSCENEEGYEVTDSPVNLNNLNLSAFATQERTTDGSSEMVGPPGHRSAAQTESSETTKPIKCILETSIGEAPHADKLKTRLKILLDPPRPLGGDIKYLACAFGYTSNEINYLTTIPHRSPTEDLLNDNGNHNIGHLLEKLKFIGRDDAAGKLEEYIISRGCKCKSCITSLR